MRETESKLSIIFNFILGPRISFVKLRVLSKSQNWPAEPWLDQSFWQSNRLFPRVFAEKASPSSILFRIWLMWLDSFYWQWNSLCGGNGLACQFWQMESTQRSSLYRSSLYRLSLRVRSQGFSPVVMSMIPGYSNRTKKENRSKRNS